jgi:hypothetical protein
MLTLSLFQLRSSYNESEFADAVGEIEILGFA